jgi:hypothetical protein
MAASLRHWIEAEMLENAGDFFARKSTKLRHTGAGFPSSP